MSSKIQFVKDMEAATFSGNWEQFKTFFADDLYYFVGNKTELRSPQAVVDYLVQFLSKELAIYNLEFLLEYENEDTVVTELSVKAVRVPDNKHVVFHTVDYTVLRTKRFETGESTPSSPLTWAMKAS
jgi:hypothetical protein